MDFVDYGPRHKSHRSQGGKLILEFDSTGGELRSAKSEPIDSFAIAEPDKLWHWANAEIKDDTINRPSPAVLKPIAVRHAFGDESLTEKSSVQSRGNSGVAFSHRRLAVVGF